MLNAILNEGFIPKVNVKLVGTEDSEFIPSRKISGDAGADLRARIDYPKTLVPGENFIIPTGVSIEILPGYVGDIRPRSGAAKDGKVVMYGTIDSNYRGEIKLNVVNMSNGLIQILPKERLAQLVIVPYLEVQFKQVKELSESERGEKGFGSTGRF
jgi:dUTP pyrophosphatase